MTEQVLVSALSVLATVEVLALPKEMSGQTKQTKKTAPVTGRGAMTTASSHQVDLVVCCAEAA
jgi:hypothetical protein